MYCCLFKMQPLTSWHSWSHLPVCHSSELQNLPTPRKPFLTLSPKAPAETRMNLIHPLSPRRDCRSFILWTVAIRQTQEAPTTKGMQVAQDASAAPVQLPIRLLCHFLRAQHLHSCYDKDASQTCSQ